MGKLYSFVIPTYNRAHCILNSISSILNQNTINFEIIIVDDGSTDDTKNIIMNQLHNDKIKYFHYENNQGANFAKNLGALNSNGEYLIFLDSDDMLASQNSLSKIEEDLANNNYPSLAMFACIDLSQNITISQENFKGFVSYSDYFTQKYKGEYLPVVKKSIFLRINFFGDIIGGEGITWNLITKEIGKIFISNTIVRIYDNKGTDRLSFFNKKNFIRIRNVFIKDLKINYKDYLKFYKLGFILILFKIIYYQFRYFLNK